MVSSNVITQQADAAPCPLSPPSSRRRTKKNCPRESCAGATRAMRNREASMNRKAAGIVFTIGVVVAALIDAASAQNSTASSALDASLRGAVERKEVPGVVALITNRQRVLYQGAF